MFVWGGGFRSGVQVGGGWLGPNLGSPVAPIIVRVPLFLLIGCNKGTQNEKGQKSTTGEPSKSLEP